jgi:hypothetical protein
MKADASQKPIEQVYRPCSQSGCGCVRWGKMGNHALLNQSIQSLINDGANNGFPFVGVACKAEPREPVPKKLSERGLTTDSYTVVLNNKLDSSGDG